MFQAISHHPPESVHVTGFWTWPGPDVLTRLRNPVRTTAAGVIEEKIALSPPPDSPLYGGLLLVNASAREPLETPHDHRVLFIGGFTPELSDLESTGGFLLMSYPTDELSDFASIENRAPRDG